MAKWIEKYGSILDYTISCLARRRGKNLSLSVVYTLVIFMLGSAVFLTEALKREATLILKGAPEMVVQRLLQGRCDPIPVSYLEKITKIRGVASAEARLWGYIFDSDLGANYTVMVHEKVILPPEHIIIGNGIARSLMIYREETMTFKLHDTSYREFTVQGLISPESELVSADLLLLSEGDFRDMFGLPRTHATDLVVKVRDTKELAAIAKKVTELLPDTRPIIRDEMMRTYDSVFDWRGGFAAVLSMMALLSLVILAWEKASGLSADEKREIGILKAIGWETSDVITLKACEGLLVSFFSFTIGVLLAYGHVFFLSAFLFAPALKGWSALYPDFRITPFIDPYQVAALFLLTVLPYAAASIVPSWRAAVVDPDSVMRS